jgi:ATP-dependent DNA ligase
MFDHAAKLGWEGIVSKRVDASYRSERNGNWLKIKTVQRGKFPVVGFIKDPSGVAALYLGRREGKDLVYMGKVGTGWSRTTSAQIRKQLDTVISPQAKLTKPIRKPKATWVEPTFYAEVGHHFGRIAAGKFFQGAIKEKTPAPELACTLTRRCPVLRVTRKFRLGHGMTGFDPRRT